MKHLLSIPSSLIESFHKLTGKPESEWVVDSDPEGSRVGSGGGTAWILYRAWQKLGSGVTFEEWLSQEQRMIIHAGGQSRRLPAYASVGKILTPVPVFRWQRGQQVSQMLLDMQTPLYRKILKQAPSNVHTLVASGDVLITTESEVKSLPEADIICFGLWISPEKSTNHGVFFCDRANPTNLEFMLQKPSVEEIRVLAPNYYFMMDIGIWLLSDRAVDILQEHCGWNMMQQQFSGNSPKNYDLYGEFGPSMGIHPRVENEKIQSLKVKIVTLEDGAFYHFGTGNDMLESVLQIQNKVVDQRAIWSRSVKPHPSIFVQNALTAVKFSENNRHIWIENSHIPSSWSINSKHILTGIPVNTWKIDLPEGICIDMVPIAGKTCLRVYGFSDKFSGKTSESFTTTWMNQPLSVWLQQRGIDHSEADLDEIDIQKAPLFPLLDDKEDIAWWIMQMTKPSEPEAFKEKWLKSTRLSAEQISAQADLFALEKQRREYRYDSLKKMSANYRKSIFYQLDLDNTAKEWVHGSLKLPSSLPADESPLLQMHHHMFTARVQQYKGEKSVKSEQKAFGILRETILDGFRARPVLPRRNVYSDQIVWGRSPARLDLAGGWTDTPPYCFIEGGAVVNMAVELNGHPPLQVFIKPTEKYSVVLRSIDLGVQEEISTYEELVDVNKVGSAFSIPRAALMLTGFHPEYCERKYASLEEQLREFGGGMEITFLAAIPKGSGLGTSSILAATIIGTIADFASLNWDKIEIGNRTLALEQLLTTGGGWQDQFGGLMHGIKCLETKSGFEQSPTLKWLPDHLFHQPDSVNSMLLYYTGITRVAKNILAEIVRGMFLNSKQHLDILREMKDHALNTFDAIQSNDYKLLASKIKYSWELNCRLDSGTNPPEVVGITDRFKDLSSGWKLLGAGGGGYLLIMAKDTEAAGRIRSVLQANPPNDRARWVNMSLSKYGFHVTRS